MFPFKLDKVSWPKSIVRIVGLTKSIATARALYCCLGLWHDFKILINKCERCQAFQQSNSAEDVYAPMKSMGPMQFVSMDLFQVKRKHYLVMVDHFSAYPFITQLTSLNIKAIMKKIKAWLQNFGFPQMLHSNLGPQFQGEFDSFCQKYDIKYDISSPYFPCSNGWSEVKNMKYLITMTSYC